MEDKKDFKILAKEFLNPHKEYLCSLFPYIILATLVFITGIVAGYYVNKFFPEKTQELISLLREEYSFILEANKFSQILFIFLKNGTASFIVLMTGAFFGVVPVISLVNNGEILGAFGSAFLKEESFLRLLAGILPHGIIEVPFFIISSAMGLKIGRTVVERIFKKKGDIKKEVALALNTFLKIVLVFLFIAAVVEVLITPELFMIF
jgi:stage II sporulation protein M